MSLNEVGIYSSLKLGRDNVPESDWPCLLYGGPKQFGINDSLTVTGNVGIGTTTLENPEGWSRILDLLGVTDAKLSVRTAKIDGRVSVHEKGCWGSPAGAMILGTKTNHALSFGTNATTKMTILGNGNVGIGTITPGAKLEVSGNLTVTGNISIATTAAPTERLEVNGNVKATSFLGDGSNLTGVVKNLDLAVKKAGDTMSGALTIQNSLSVTGEIIAGSIKWGNNSRLSSDQGGSIELGGNANTPGQGTPYIDFHFAGLTQDYNTRIINDADGRLSLVAQEICLSSYGGGTPVGAMSIDVGTFGTMENAGNSYFFRVRDIGAGPSTPFYIRGDGQVFGQFAQSSSKELKENIGLLSLQEAAQILAGLNPVKFNYKTDSDQHQNIGFIAEDVPELLATSDRKGVSIMDIVGVLTKVLQEQQTTISVLTEKIKALESQSQKAY
ncbi:MAG: tail fiber domain-containing protein [Microcystis sp. LE19-84.1B]|jgi:hypothetical protein|uniref:tail fiber domain-containing protein n=1 Tax=Microcystis sp. LE19-84.1B TaxID=3016438 RepID=UPI0022BD3BE1|nr:tail fiber domain-containing protein [Microcystis sp. LE19-84.1B]MCZ8222595.1 tail fiber domain-containing protein [Microcystis sp. LE19-84.1B]